MYDRSLLLELLLENVLAHDYFDIDSEEVYQICSTEIGILKWELEKMRYDIFQS